ncbi:MAG: orotidine-5'-phosphate decarboxylase [Nitriliruptorales bacterium]|nr:orotidine-5'-phosphate decarboxylase [Nitriliruptorales bacterium]
MDSPAGFFDRLRLASRARSSLLCVGLDPSPEHLDRGADGALAFCTDIVERTHAATCCYKPNAAFWEQYGPDGWRALALLRARIPDDIPVLLDGKRADVAPTMRAYATAAFDALRMDAATVHAYHGSDSLREYTRYADRGVYVVCRTSNPGSRDLQHLLTPDVPLYLRVARLAASLDTNSNVGLVVGTTAPEQVREIREHHPEIPFLLPGIGWQGGDLEAAVGAAWNGDPASCLISVSRGVLYADDPAKAADVYRRQINDVLATSPAPRSAQ